MGEPEKWDDVTDENWQETAFLVGVSSKGRQERTGYTIPESLDELARLANSAGLQVCLSSAPFSIIGSPLPFATCSSAGGKLF